MLEASLERAGVGLSSVRTSTEGGEVDSIRIRHEALFDPTHVSRLRVLLRAIALTGLATLCFLLL